MEVISNSFMPGDPRLVQQLVNELKSQGIFDQFRKECFADVDTKPAYQNLRQRVEGSVAAFLKEQTWSPDMNKNQVREQLKKNIYESGYLETGVERIVDQVVNPKISTVFLPIVEDVVYKYLGIEKRQDPQMKVDENVTDLLPKDLEAVSPESVRSSKLDQKDDPDTLNDSTNSKMDEDESPPFEPLEGVPQNITILQEETSLDSELSGISGLQSHESNLHSESKSSQMDWSWQDPQLSQNSSESKLSVVTSEEQKLEISREIMFSKNTDSDSMGGINKIEEDTMKTDDSVESMVIEEDDSVPEIQKQDKIKDDKSSEADETEQKFSKTSREDDSKKNKEKKSNDIKKDEKKSKSSSHKSHSKDDKYSSKEDKNVMKEDKHSSKDDKHRKSSSSTKDKDKSSSRHSSSSKDRDSKDNVKGKEKTRDSKDDSKNKEKDLKVSKDYNEKDRHDRDKMKDKYSKNKEKDDEKSSKQKFDKDKKSRKDDDKEKESEKSKYGDKEKEKSSKEKSERQKSEKETSSKDTNERDRERSKDRSDKKKSHRERDKSEKSNDKPDKNDRKERDRSKSSSSINEKSSSNSKDSAGSINSKKKESDKDTKPSDKHKRDKHSRDKSAESNKDKKRESKKDDHYSSKEKKNHRRSFDRDSSDGQSGKYSNTINSENKITNSQQSSSKDSSSNSLTGSGDSGNSEPSEIVSENQEKPETENEIQTPIEVPKMKYIKPKFALNFEEAKRIMKIRRQLAILERQNQLSLADLNIGQNGFTKKKPGRKPKMIISETQNEDVNTNDDSDNTPKNSPFRGFDRDSEQDLEKDIVDTKEKLTSADLNLQSIFLSKENWEALEARLEEEMLKINFNAYESHYDDYDDTDCSAIIVSPISDTSVRNSCVIEEIKPRILLDGENQKTVNEKEAELVEETVDDSITIIDQIDEKKEKEKYTNNHIIEKKELSIRLLDMGMGNNEDEMKTEFKERTDDDDASYSNCCTHFKKCDLVLRNVEFLHKIIRKLEDDLEYSIKEYQNNILPDNCTKVVKRGRKRKFDENVDFKNNNKLNYTNPTGIRKRGRPPKISAVNTSLVHSCSNTDMVNQNFSLPLSPADNENSTEKHVEHTFMKQRKMSTPRMQRYTSDDLYKPRPTVPGTKRSKREKHP